MYIFETLIILFWLSRNLYFIILVLLMISGRDDDSDVDAVIVKAGEAVTLKVNGNSTEHFCITSTLTEHRIRLFVDENDICKVGDITELLIETDDYSVELKGVAIDVLKLKHSDHAIVSVEILDYKGNEEEYIQMLHDRIPTLPQSLSHDFGMFKLFWRNIVYRMIRTV